MIKYLPAPLVAPAGECTVGIVATDPETIQCARSCASQRPFYAVFEQPTARRRQQVLGCVEVYHPQVLLLELCSTGDELASLLAQVRLLVPDCQIIGIGKTAATEEMMAALRAGCNDYAWPPLEGSLRQALARAAAALSEGQPDARPGGTVLGFLSAKGGCGSTTIACHTAVELSRLLTEKVLLLDLDFSAGMVGFLTGVARRHSFLDAVTNTHRLDSSLWDALVTDRGGLDVLPAPPRQ